MVGDSKDKKEDEEAALSEAINSNKKINKNHYLQLFSHFKKQTEQHKNHDTQTLLDSGNVPHRTSAHPTLLAQADTCIKA